MERKIKFRGKSIKSGKWLYGYLGEAKTRILNSVYTDKVIFDNVFSFSTDNNAYVSKDFAVDEETIGQFTDLYDKNGKEIYEGDIVDAPYVDSIFKECHEGTHVNAVIRFINGSFVVEYSEDCRIYLHDLYDKVKVIGNIYDNPELLAS